jgi:hypothetical protein
MPGFMPGIHALIGRNKGVDGRDKPGHDGSGCRASEGRSLNPD